MKVMLRNVLAATVLAFAGSAQATVFAVDGVLGGSSGFGASSFHDASGSNAMSGPIVADVVEGAGIFGTYNDVSGALSVSGLSLTGGTGAFALTGTLLFDGLGKLSVNSMLFVDFDATAEGNGLVDATLGFLPGYVCCGSTAYDPNSFLANGSDMWMTLWGADYGYSGAFNGSYDGANLGMDLRLSMSPTSVPEPSILVLLSVGLLALGFTRRIK